MTRLSTLPPTRVILTAARRSAKQYAIALKAMGTGVAATAGELMDYLGGLAPGQRRELIDQ